MHWFYIEMIRRPELPNYRGWRFYVVHSNDRPHRALWFLRDSGCGKEVCSRKSFLAGSGNAAERN